MFQKKHEQVNMQEMQIDNLDQQRQTFQTECKKYQEILTVDQRKHDKNVEKLDVDITELEERKKKCYDNKNMTITEMNKMKREREDTEDAYINLKEGNNKANLDYAALNEKVSRAREEIYNLRRQVEAEQLIKETRETEERKTKRGRHQSNQGKGGKTPPKTQSDKKNKKDAMSILKSSMLSIDTQDRDFDLDIPEMSQDGEDETFGYDDNDEGLSKEERAHKYEESYEDNIGGLETLEKSGRRESRKL